MDCSALPANLYPPLRSISIGFRQIAADYLSHRADQKSRPKPQGGRDWLKRAPLEPSYGNFERKE
jgi:hypothetical protein